MGSLVDIFIPDHNGSVRIATKTGEHVKAGTDH
jgi:hypothetical protein